MMPTEREMPKLTGVLGVLWLVTKEHCRERQKGPKQLSLNPFFKRVESCQSTNIGP
jgi:hypothetical protein